MLERSTGCTCCHRCWAVSRVVTGEGWAKEKVGGIVVVGEEHGGVGVEVGGRGDCRLFFGTVVDCVDMVVVKRAVEVGRRVVLLYRRT